MTYNKVRISASVIKPLIRFWNPHIKDKRIGNIQLVAIFPLNNPILLGCINAQKLVDNSIFSIKRGKRTIIIQGHYQIEECQLNYQIDFLFLDKKVSIHEVNQTFL